MTNGTEIKNKVANEVYGALGLEERLRELLSGFMTNTVGTLPEDFDDEPFNRFSIISSLTFFSDPNIIFAVAASVAETAIDKIDKIEKYLLDITREVNLVNKESSEISGTDYSSYIEGHIKNSESKIDEVQELISDIRDSIYGGGICPSGENKRSDIGSI